MRAYRCGECGTLGMKLKNIKGRTIPFWMDKTDIIITEDLELYCCDNCSNFALTSNQCHLLDEAIRNSLLKKLPNSD